MIYKVTLWLLLANLGTYGNKMFILHVHIILLYACNTLLKVLCFLTCCSEYTGSDTSFSMPSVCAGLAAGIYLCPSACHTNKKV